MSTAGQKTAGTFTGRHMWMLALGFFGVIIAVNIGMATVAMRSWTGLVVDNSYVASQDFEEKRLAHEAQIAAGWHADFSYGEGTARLVIVDKANIAVDLGAVTLLLNRPVGGHDDQVLTLAADAKGVYSAAVELPEGLWEATVTADNTALGPYELRARIRVAATK